MVSLGPTKLLANCCQHARENAGFNQHTQSPLIAVSASLVSHPAQLSLVNILYGRLQSGNTHEYMTTL
jgi:hypothetical protein